MFYDLIEDMASKDAHHNLSIIAVRILPHCQNSVRKCLKEDLLYNLNNNFQISSDSEFIKTRRGDVGIIDDSFFVLEKDNTHPNISISAIVGKNGDGKSSLVEFMIRLINNFACRKGLNLHGDLIYVNNVYGELFYRLDSRFFRIRISHLAGENDSVTIYEYNWDETNGAYKKNDSELEYEDIQRLAFYTLVSNYSHFAYNTEEFAEERADNEGNHWLKKVFHKNDAYQTPLNIHPYRDKGNIDINRERLLSSQRLLTSIARSLSNRIKNKGNHESIFEINGKRPVELNLFDTGKSKLQEVTLRKYFEDNRNKNIIEGEIRRLKESIESTLNKNSIIDKAADGLECLSEQYLMAGFMNFAEKAIEWLDEKKLLNDRSDIEQLLDEIQNWTDNAYVEKGYVHNVYVPRVGLNKSQMKNWRKIQALSALQFLRLALVYDICMMWNKGVVADSNKGIELSFDPLVVFKDYDDMTYDERACHYIIYKTIEIFSTYPSYEKSLVWYDYSQLFFVFRGPDPDYGTLASITTPFERLSKDWKKRSHNTLKLRQAYRFLMASEADKSIYSNRTSPILFDKMGENEISILSNIETLPPPIFKWEIMFKKNDEDPLIPFSSFSSGEKQKIFFREAVVYHLQNLSSVGDEKIHYHAVNLIFEEIELYFHPEWQRTLIDDLMKAIRGANIPQIHSVNMIFVTHSPYILSDIPKSNVLFLKDGRPTYDMQENTFGANINSLLKNGFFLPSLPMGEFAYKKINSLFAKLHSGEFDSEDIDQLYAQIMTVGEPAIRMQLMKLFAPFKLFKASKEEMALFVWDVISKKFGNASN